MGSCVLKECGFQLNNHQLKKERQFKETIKTDYFMQLADDFVSSKGKQSLNSKKTIIPKSPNFENKLSQSPKFNSPGFKLTMNAKQINEIDELNAIDQSENKGNGLTKQSSLEKSDKSLQIIDKNEKVKKKSAMKGNLNKKEKSEEDLRKSGTSDYHTGFHNKLFLNEKISSDNENGKEFEQIFKDDIDSDDENYIERLFPSSLQKALN